MPEIVQLPLGDDAEFLDMFELLKRRLPILFVQRWDGLTGEGAMRGIARVFAELRRRIKTQSGSVLLREATGAFRAEGTITVTFDDPTAYAYTIAAGSIIAATRWGIRFKLSAPLARTAGQAAGSATVAVVAEWAGDWANIAPNMTTQWGIVDTSNPASLLWTATSDDGKSEFLERVRQGRIGITASSRMEGGRMATLDLRAAGRGVPRVVDEPDETLRSRARTVPLDVITDNGIVRAANKSLGYEGATLVNYWETGFAWGVSGWGLHPWSRKYYAALLIPEGEDIAAMQALVDQIKLHGVWIQVLPKAV